MQGGGGEAGGRGTVWVGSEEGRGAGPGPRMGSQRGQSHSGKEALSCYREEGGVFSRKKEGGRIALRGLVLHGWGLGC